MNWNYAQKPFQGVCLVFFYNTENKLLFSTKFIPWNFVILSFFFWILGYLNNYFYFCQQDANLDFSTFLKHPGHFDMDFKEFEFHFWNIVTSPHLSVFKYHHLLPVLVERGRIANERLTILKHLNMKCYNLKVLTGTARRFFR